MVFAAGRPLLSPALVALLVAGTCACSGDGLPPGAPLDLAATRVDLATTPDMADRLPFDNDLALLIRGLDGDEGRTARLRVHETVLDRRTPWRDVVIQGGRIAAYLPGGFDGDTFGELVEVFVDRLGDGACTGGTDPAWVLFINNTFPMDKVVRADIDVAAGVVGGSRVAMCSELPP